MRLTIAMFKDDHPDVDVFVLLASLDPQANSVVMRSVVDLDLILSATFQFARGLACFKADQCSDPTANRDCNNRAVLVEAQDGINNPTWFASVADYGRITLISALTTHNNNPTYTQSHIVCEGSWLCWNKLYNDDTKSDNHMCIYVCG